MKDNHFNLRQVKNAFEGITLLIIFLSSPLNNVFAQINNERRITSEELGTLNSERKLIAGKVTTKLETATIDSIRMLYELEEEDEMSPADELYDGIWDTDYLKVYSDITIPETYVIDLSSFVMPVEGKITSSFGPRRRRFHYGTDLKLQVGDTVYAAFEGKVRVVKYERRGYGYYVVIRHPNGLETVYGHLSQFLVEEEENVDAGQPIALGGNTGRSTGPHLHFECRFLGHAIDPADIVDFDNFCTFDESYLFQKSKINELSINNNKYVAKNRSVKYHRIRSGDTLSRIAQRHGVSVNQICRLNGLRPTSTLKVGKVLRCS